MSSSKNITLSELFARRRKKKTKQTHKMDLVCKALRRGAPGQKPAGGVKGHSLWMMKNSFLKWKKRQQRTTQESNFLN